MQNLEYAFQIELILDFRLGVKKLNFQDRFGILLVVRFGGAGLFERQGAVI